MMKLVARKRFCKHCRNAMVFWVNGLGELTYWCRRCDTLPQKQ